MISTLSWCVSRCGLVLASLLLAGCGRVTLGTAVGAGSEAAPASAADLLISPSRFPRLSRRGSGRHGRLSRALQDVDGDTAARAAPRCRRRARNRPDGHFVGIRTLTLAAHIGATRVSATWLKNGERDEPDAALLDSLFHDAVLEARRGGRANQGVG